MYSKIYEIIKMYTIIPITCTCNSKWNTDIFPVCLHVFLGLLDTPNYFTLPLIGECVFVSTNN